MATKKSYNVIKAHLLSIFICLYAVFFVQKSKKKACNFWQIAGFCSFFSF